MPAEADPRSVSPRYDFEEIDLDSGGVHADVVNFVQEGSRVLELGPATGYMSRVFAERGCTVVGVEVDAAMAERAAGFCERLIVGDLDTLDLEAELGDERFDAIVSADVIEHLKDPLGTLRRLRRFLGDDGRFVISIPNVGPWERAARAALWPLRVPGLGTARFDAPAVLHPGDVRAVARRG